MIIAVLGCGAWGTALARLLHQGGHTVTRLGAYRPSGWTKSGRPDGMSVFCPASICRGTLIMEPVLARAIAGAEVAVVAVPSQVFRQVTRQLADFAGIVVSVTKGVEYDTGLTMSGVLEQNAPRARNAALVRPELRASRWRGTFPRRWSSASAHAETAEAVQKLFSRPGFRVYTSTDVLGVELGGALKNVIAIAAGVSDGLGFGDNSKAALVTRAIAEMRRLGVACGAQADTFAGLSGLGDLMVTCFSRQSRNRGFGERLGRGEKPAAIAASMAAGGGRVSHGALAPIELARKQKRRARPSSTRSTRCSTRARTSRQGACGI